MKKADVPQTGILLAGIALFLRCSDTAAAGIRSALSFCSAVLIPSLFPVSVLSGCLLRLHAADGTGRFTERWMRKLFGLPGTGALPLLLGMLGGFPLGAQLAASACKAEQLTKREASRLAGISNNAGPAFLLGTVSTMLHAPRIGIRLLGIQILSALLTGLLLRGKAEIEIKKALRPGARRESLASILPSCIAESAGAMLRLTGAVAFFQAFSACLTPALARLPALWQTCILGIMELTGGLSALSETYAQAELPLAACLICWGGLCVHLQAAQALTCEGLPLAPYLLRKALQAGIGMLLAIILF